MKNLLAIFLLIFLFGCGGSDDSTTPIPSPPTVAVATLPTLSLSVPELSNDNTPTISGMTDVAASSEVTFTVTDSNKSVESLSTKVNSDGSFSVDLDKQLSEGKFDVEASVSNNAGVTNKNAVGVIDTIAPEISILLDENITDDDLISNDEKQQQIVISGSVSGEFNEGDVVTLTVNKEEVVGNIIENGRFEISVSGINLFEDEDHIIDAMVMTIDLAGNSASAINSESYYIFIEPSSITALVEDCFTCSTSLPYGSHGYFVLNVIKGIAHELPALLNINYLTHEINDGYSSDRDFDTEIHLINISSSTHSNTNDEMAERIQAFSPFPLIITSAGNGGNECTATAAEVGRVRGLSASALGHGTTDEHPDIDILYKACDMQMVAAMDAEIVENWIVVGGDFIGGQRPGIYKHRWIAAPYKNLKKDGTSFGTPLVSYYASMIQSRMPFLDPDDVATIIFDTADKTGMYADSDEFGHGLLNPAGIEAYLIERGY